jgi:hypothetical protein
MNMSISKTGRKTAAIAAGMLGLLAVAGASAGVPAGDKEDEISFDLVPNPQFVDCLRATVIRGKLNDTLFLDLDGFKPGLQFDLFTVQHSPFFDNGTKDPSFMGSFGLAWYQSDIEIGKHRDEGRVRIKTILLDQIFGFDPDVTLPPTNTFHVGFWFNNPADAQHCSLTPIKPTPFNGEHQAGPFAMISTTNITTHLGPLCTDPKDPTRPTVCNP